MHQLMLLSKVRFGGILDTLSQSTTSRPVVVCCRVASDLVYKASVQKKQWGIPIYDGQ